MNEDTEEEEIITISLNCRVCKRNVEVSNFRSMVELTKKIGILCGRCKATALFRILWG